MTAGNEKGQARKKDPKKNNKPSCEGTTGGREMQQNKDGKKEKGVKREY